MVAYQVKVSSKHKNTKLRWLASDINSKLLHTGCPIAHGNTNENDEQNFPLFAFLAIMTLAFILIFCPLGGMKCP